MPKPTERVDAVLAFHVIEHLDAPLDVLAAARDLVVDGGILYVRVPNYGGLNARLLRAAWAGYDPGHLHYFTRRSLQEAAERSGWHVHRLETRGHAWPWIVGVKRKLSRFSAKSGEGSDRPPSGPGLGPRGVWLLQMDERLLTPVAWLESRSGKGNELVMIAVRGAGGC